MRKKQRQLWAVLLPIAIIVSLAGCGAGALDNPKQSNNPSTSDQQPIQPSNEDELPEKREQEPEIIRETIEDKAQKALATLEVWDGSIAESFDGGDGSAGNPYQIANGAQLAKLASDTNSGVDFSGKYFMLISDILLNDFSQWTYDNSEWVFGNQLDGELIASHSSISFGSARNWKPIGLNYYFSGTFDGGGHIIWGLLNNEFYQNSYGSIAGNVGLLGTLREGSVSNVTVAYSWMSPWAEYVGTIVGESDAGLIDNCHVLQTVVSANAKCVGGICGNISMWDSGGKISNSSAGGLIYCNNPIRYANIAIGGIAGAGNSYSNSGMIINCYNGCTIEVDQANISGDGDSGLGGRIRSPGIYVGGICGTSAVISGCHNMGRIEVEAHDTRSENSDMDIYAYIGGIASSCENSISNCSNSGNLIYSGDIVNAYLGGIAGQLVHGADVTLCYSNAQMVTNASDENIGGIVGVVNGQKLSGKVDYQIEITNCYYNKEYSNRASAVSINGNAFTDQVRGFSEAEFKNEANYYGFDFNSTWSIDANRNGGMPVPVALIQYFEN